jgi:DnaJ-class molecular chaperone
MTFGVEKLKNPQKLSKKECMKDLYKVLGVSRSSSPQALKAAYQSKVRFFLNDSESLESLKMAYAILISSELRAEYDAFQDMGGMKWSMRRGVDIMDRGIVLSGSFGG